MPNQNHHIFIFAGEHSGDLHGSHLIKALKKYGLTLTLEGVGGPRMRDLGISGPLNMEDFEVMGLTDVLLTLPKLYRYFYKIRNHILRSSPHIVILIDYPGFNLRLAKALRQHGYRGKIVQYVSPSIWAWGKHRIRSMENTLDLLMTIYPFEPAYFCNSPLKTVYVGNPIQEYIGNYVYDDAWQNKLGINLNKNLIALFPGSRPGEIKRNLPILLKAAHGLYRNTADIQFAVSCPNDTAEKFLAIQLKSADALFKNNIFQVPKHYTYELMRDSCTAAAKSGTVMLELALHKRPSIAIYKLTLVNRLYAKHILKLQLPYYCIVNILANRQVFPEFIEKDLNAKNLSRQLQSLHEFGIPRKNCLEECERLKSMLGNHNASLKAAEYILEMLSC